jgi:hypothetical protein
MQIKYLDLRVQKYEVSIIKLGFRTKNLIALHVKELGSNKRTRFKILIICIHKKEAHSKFPPLMWLCREDDCGSR